MISKMHYFRFHFAMIIFIFELWDNKYFGFSVHLQKSSFLQALIFQNSKYRRLSEAWNFIFMFG